MKKKIKNLTWEEAKKVCSKCKNCINCPLYLDVYLCIKDLIGDEILDQEIEIEEKQI